MFSLSKEAINAAMQGHMLDVFSTVELKRSGQEYKGLCPLHEDKTPSFCVAPETGMWKCFGCGKGGDVYQFVMETMGLDFPKALNYLADKFGVSAESDCGSLKPASSAAKIVAEYSYTDQEGQLLFQSLRMEPKTFRLRRPDEKGGWIPDIKGISLVLYHLPEVIAAVSVGETIYIAEGEKDVDRLRTLGLASTCNPMGANKWKAGQESYNPPLRGARVVVFADNDDVGKQHAEQVAQSLTEVATSVQVVHLPDLPPKGDVSDWLDAGGTAEKLLGIVQETPHSTLGQEVTIETHVAPRNNGPAIDPAALYGLAGDIVKAIEPHTEADPVALLIQFLVAFGSIIGRKAHFKAEWDEHYCNMFAVLVGQSSKARKGTSWGYVKGVFKRVAPDWVDQNLASGLSSGEGLIHAVRDRVEKEGKDKDTGDMVTKVTDPGVEDKRLLVQESEFAAVLRVASRDGNTVSAFLRNFWDSGNAQTMTKQSPARATGAHISIIGHITRDELRSELSSTDSANGFGNRFLWFYVKRSKELPEGGNLDEASLNSLICRLRRAIQHATGMELMKRDEQARQLWCGIYHDLSAAKPGLAGAVTSRSEAQVMRLATLYALLDASADICREHLLAAIALWQYSEASARYIFGESTGDSVADKIWNELRKAKDGLTRTEIRDLCQKNQPAERIEQALNLLEECGRVECRTVKTGGRPAEKWFAVVFTDQVALPAPASD